MDQFLFPHEIPRKIQGAFVLQVNEAIKNKQNFLVHAPTGIGKTASVLAPALTNAIKDDLTVFFLTSRHTQHKIAIDTLRQIKQKHDVKLIVVDMVGKKWMCGQSGVSALTSSEFSEYCKEIREKGKCLYYNNLKTKGKPSITANMVLDELKRIGPQHVEEMNKICMKSKLCPYEISCMLGKEANVIIADYYHVLNSHIRDNLFKKIDKHIEECVLIFDEAHNLSSRARKLLTSEVNTITIDLAIKEARQEELMEIADDLAKINEILSSFSNSKLTFDKQECLINKNEFIVETEKITDYEELCGNFTFVAEQVLEKKKRSFAGNVAAFMESWTGPDDGFVRIVSRGFSRSGKPYVSLAYKCMDPALAIKPLVTQCHSAIAMSGTLTPTEMYTDLYGMPKDKTVTVEYDNPFPAKNRLNIIIPETTTKYTARSDKMYELIAKKCAEVVNLVPGNCVIFFPSYRIRDDVYNHFQNLCLKTTFLEQSGTSKEERADLLERFKSYKDEGAVLLGASSGSFGEGIDLIGDFLKAVVVVGLPLGKPDLETQELIAYYDQMFGRGWDYGYVYPAIIKTMQNAGRCIRSDTDRGVVVFLDERYMWRSYFNCFPKDWNIEVNTNPAALISEFFKNG
jgi:DNA excision repair protein ERCC-2